MGEKRRRYSCFTRVAVRGASTFMKYCLAKVRRRTAEPLTPAICVLGCIRDACANTPVGGISVFYDYSRARCLQLRGTRPHGGKRCDASLFPARAVVLGMNCENEQDPAHIVNNILRALGKREIRYFAKTKVF